MNTKLFSVILLSFAASVMLIGCGNNSMSEAEKREFEAQLGAEADPDALTPESRAAMERALGGGGAQSAPGGN